MAAKRQDRLLERQRGAGTRQIKNSGFDLLLPGQAIFDNVPLVPQKSGRSRKTPQPESSHQFSTRQTTAPEDTSHISPSRKTPAKTQRRKRRRPETVPEVDEGAAATDRTDGVAPKKRKLNSGAKSERKGKDGNTADGYTAPERLKNSQVTKPDEGDLPKNGTKKRRKRRSIGQQSIRKARLHGESPLKPAPQPRRREPKPKPPLRTESVHPMTPEPPVYTQVTAPTLQERERSQEPAAVELVDAKITNQDSPRELDNIAAKPKPRKRKRKPIGKGPPKDTPTHPVEGPIGANDTEQLSAEPAELPQSKVKRPHKPKANNTASLQTAPIEREIALERSESNALGGRIPEDAALIDEAELAIPNEAPSEQMPRKRRKKRRSIGQQSSRSKKRAKTLDAPQTAASTKASAPEPGKDHIASSEVTEAVQVLARDKDQAPADGEEDVSQEGPVQPEIPVPKKKRGRPRKIDTAFPNKTQSTNKSTQPRTQEPKTTKPSIPKSRKPPKNTIPITYYAPPSPTSSTTPSPSDLETTADAPSNPKLIIPKGINAVDVLSQVCREIISKTSMQFDEKADAEPAQAAEYKRRKQTVDIYGEELDARLLQLTVAVNENSALSARMRKQAAEERKLKREIKALQAERESVRARKEEIAKGRKAGELEVLLDGIARAAKKGWELEARGRREAMETPEG